VVAKYCREHDWLTVRLSVCLSGLSASISPEPRKIFTKFFVRVVYGRGSVVHGDEIQRGRGNFGVFLPIDNPL